ncbi:hypothetical protein C3L33_12860, partial [Rhododendron williamsianum]
MVRIFNSKLGVENCFNGYGNYYGLPSFVFEGLVNNTEISFKRHEEETLSMRLIKWSFAVGLLKRNIYCSAMELGSGKFSDEVGFGRLATSDAWQIALILMQNYGASSRGLPLVAGGSSENSPCRNILKNVRHRESPRVTQFDMVEGCQQVADKLGKMGAAQDLQMVPMTGPHLMLWNSWWMMQLE